VAVLKIGLSIKLNHHKEYLLAQICETLCREEALPLRHGKTVSLHWLLCFCKFLVYRIPKVKQIENCSFVLKFLKLLAERSALFDTQIPLNKDDLLGLISPT
jgi:hypothetical protein